MTFVEETTKLTDSMVSASRMVSAVAECVLFLVDKVCENGELEEKQEKENVVAMMEAEIIEDDFAECDEEAKNSLLEEMKLLGLPIGIIPTSFSGKNVYSTKSKNNNTESETGKKRKRNKNSIESFIEKENRLQHLSRLENYQCHLESSFSSFSFSCEMSRPSDLDGKYWDQRYSLFHLFHRGALLDTESFFSITPEKIANHISDRCEKSLQRLKKVNKVERKFGAALDLFGGCGGNSISLTKYFNKVFSVEIDPLKQKYCFHNAKLYGVSDKLSLHCMDVNILLKELSSLPKFPIMSLSEKIDVAVNNINNPKPINNKIVIRDKEIKPPPPPPKKPPPPPFPKNNSNLLLNQTIILGNSLKKSKHIKFDDEGEIFVENSEDLEVVKKEESYIQSTNANQSFHIEKISDDNVGTKRSLMIVNDDFHVNKKVNVSNDENRNSENNGESDGNLDSKISCDESVDVIVMSPPWGGPDYVSAENFDLHSLPCGDLFGIARSASRVCGNLVLVLPRNTAVKDLKKLQKHIQLPCIVEKMYVNQKFKMIIVYFGSLFISK